MYIYFAFMLQIDYGYTLVTGIILDTIPGSMQDLLVGMAEVSHNKNI